MWMESERAPINLNGAIANFVQSEKFFQVESSLNNLFGVWIDIDKKFYGKYGSAEEK